MGPHALAFDSQGRLFVADRSNNRVQILDKDMKFVDEWRHFQASERRGHLKDDTLIVSDSESNRAIAGPPQARKWRQLGAQPVVEKRHSDRRRKDGSLKYPSRCEPGMAADELGNIFAGLTGGGAMRARRAAAYRSS
jgi:hypothetical protein